MIRVAVVFFESIYDLFLLTVISNIGDYDVIIVLDIIRIIYLFRFSNIVLFWLILKLEKILKNKKVFIYLQI